jgi:hypothetical protein
MLCKRIADLCIFYDQQEQEAAAFIHKAIEKSVNLLQQRWRLTIPPDCRVYIMTNWLSFLFQSAPWPWKIYLALTLPFTAARARAIWPHAGGWALRYGRRTVVGIKPPRLIEASNRSLGLQIFQPDRNLHEIVQTVTCHELTHAFTFHLKLPTWLNEGLATLAMEYYLGRQIVRTDTLSSLHSNEPDKQRRLSKRPRVNTPEDIIQQYVRGYWLTRFIDETRPALLVNLLSKRHHPRELEEQVSAALGIRPGAFWEPIYDLQRSYYRVLE